MEQYKPLFLLRLQVIVPVEWVPGDEDESGLRHLPPLSVHLLLQPQRALRGTPTNPRHVTFNHKRQCQARRV